MVVGDFSYGVYMPRKYEKKRCFEITCDRCGKRFLQKRSNQRFCCEECGVAYNKCNVSEFRKLKQMLVNAFQEIKELREKIKKLEENW